MATFHAIAARHDDKGRISSLLVTAEWPIVAEKAREMRRADVCYLMGLSPSPAFFTAYREGTEWKLGEQIHSYPFAGRHYLSTEANDTKEDTIGTLPPF